MNQKERIQSLFEWSKVGDRTVAESIERLEWLRSTGMAVPSQIEDINFAIARHGPNGLEAAAAYREAREAFEKAKGNL